MAVLKSVSGLFLLHYYLGGTSPAADYLGGTSPGTSLGTSPAPLTIWVAPCFWAQRRTLPGGDSCSYLTLAIPMEA